MNLSSGIPTCPSRRLSEAHREECCQGIPTGPAGTAYDKFLRQIRKFSKIIPIDTSTNLPKAASASLTALGVDT